MLLHELFQGTRPVVGVDLSTGMVELAKAAIAKYQEQQQQQQQQHQQQQQLQQEQAEGARQEGTATSRSCAAGGAAGAGGAALEAHVGDASRLHEHAPAAAVVSVFGLQQMGAVAPQVRAWGQCVFKWSSLLKRCTPVLLRSVWLPIKHWAPHWAQ